MNKKVIGFIMTGLMAVGVGMAAQQPVQAKSTIKSVWQDNEPQLKYYTASKKNAYIWNTNFTRRIHNLKNYPNTTWYVNQQVIYNHKVYYRLSNFSGTAQGYTWRGNVAPYLLKPMTSFKSNEDYLKYLNTDKSQKVARAILKLMPNAEVDYKLSYAAAKTQYEKLSKIKGYTSVIPLSNLEMKFKGAGYTYTNSIRQQIQTNAPTALAKAGRVKNILDHNGYNAEKLNSLFKQGYKLGIYISDVNAYSAGKYGYPTTVDLSHKDGTDMDTLVLAK
ncbi:hypothetical protein [Lentilactobacillus senioris]|nr:hypothetical protein [Lentilactobacillus senioris]